MDAPAPRQDLVLAVDLDGTLLRSDILHETFWSAFGRDWTTPLVALRALGSGRAALKEVLAERAEVNVADLPFDPAVLAYVAAWREAGGRTALVTASTQAIASRVAAHLNVFDEAHGSQGAVNLKGPAKAEFLVERFGDKGFAYVGDAAADIKVWERAGRVITANASPAIQRLASRIDSAAEHLPTARSTPQTYLRALRPHQWLKNLLVFVPMLAGHHFDGATVLRSIVAFVVFCLVASSIYLINDLLDLGADRAHPRKRLRPVASGSLPIAHAAYGAMALLGVGAAGALALGWQFALVMLAYFGLTTAYSLHLKRRIVIDICLLAGLYTMRVLAGAVATGIVLSVWLLAFSTFFFFALAAVKRQAELVDGVRRGQITASGRGYHVDDLPIIGMIGIGSGYVSVLVLALYLNSPAVLELYSQPAALWGICCILLYWLTRMVMITHRGRMHDDPVVFAARDRISLICVTAALVFAVGGTLL